MRSERGSILIFVAVSIVLLTAFSALVVDYGVIWVSRRQAQNAADAAALAGATALAYDSSDTSATGPAYQSALAAAQQNTVFGQSATPEVLITNGGTSFTSPPSCAGSDPKCVQVNIYRDGTAGSQTLPSFFAVLLGVSSQSVRATATAQVTAGNATTCLKPWIVPDRFTGPDWTANKSFSNFFDTYTPPTAANSTGWGRADIGTTITLNTPPPPSTSTYRISLNLGGNYLDNISGCTSSTYKIGDDVMIGSGASAADEAARIQEIVDQDPDASVNTSTGAIENSCAPSCSCGSSCANGMNGQFSPRIVSVALANPRDLKAGGTVQSIVNVMSFLILPPVGGTIQGVLVATPGQFNPGANNVNSAYSFVSIPWLVR
jgi:Flp pilus assembly protein TadG